MPSKVKKAVFPVAGMGTRFLPATKANPKEMLPIVDKPLIQYAVEEAVDAGCEQLIFVTSSSKRAIEDHFDKNYELESLLEEKGKNEILNIVQGILPKGVHCVYIRQAEALGLGHAVLCAAGVVGDEPFAVILADDLIDGGNNPCLKQMVETYENEGGSSVIGVESVGADETDKYGIVATTDLGNKIGRVDQIVEKPKPADAPSNLAVVGRYVLTPRIFELLRNIGKGAGGEIQLTDAIAQLLEYERVLAYEFDGIRYDCGDKLGYLKATVEYGLKHKGLGEDFRKYLQAFCVS
ncbi:MAG: UTP--glucose-1-phosphate uridylyltransferase GalU [Gammaproteobacteria bacterium]|nr:UTP--glucose-1-phosphate uridylyltransferase GalU [Gammaproteobacteria bacterium]MDH5729588.1 UTP--glucose-1-phosphate uridylyltransferase GalU [Gammaproteobacteria bacterium]